MKKGATKLEQLKHKHTQLKAQIQHLEAAEKMKERKRETRRKILIGAYYWDKAKTEGTLQELAQQMESYLKRNADRALFDLPPIDANGKQQMALLEEA